VNVAGYAIVVVIGLMLPSKVLGQGIQVVQSGNWPAPSGISLVADVFSAVMVTITTMMAFAVAVYSVSSMAQHEDLQDARDAANNLYITPYSTSCI
jgi:multicomponent Na+:H+ antiporter subunit D